MQEIFRTNEPAEIALIKSLLDSAKIRFFVFDEYLTSALGGTLDNISECRFMVLEDDMEAAFDLLEEAGLFDEEVEAEIFTTTDNAKAALAKAALDHKKVEYYVEEEKTYTGLIPKIGKANVTYRFIVRDEDADDACEVIEKAGLYEEGA